MSQEELLFLTRTFDLVSNGTLEIETEDDYDATNAMNMFAEDVCEEKLLFWLFFPFCLVFVPIFVIGDWNFVVDCLRYTRRTKQCFKKSICFYYAEMRCIVDVSNKTRTMHVAMFRESSFFTRPTLTQKCVRNDTSPFHSVMQLGRLIGLGFRNRKALRKFRK